MTAPATVSVVIPVFNRARTVGAALASVVAQDFPVSDIIVVDDGSTDDLADVLPAFAGRVNVLRHPGNRGAASARNTGIAAATGEFVAFLDSDDTWLPGKLTAQIGAMQANDWVASCTAYRLARAGRPDAISPRGAGPSLGRDDLAWGCFVSPGSTLVCRRDVFSDVGLFDLALKRLEDWDWLMRFSRKHALGFLAEPLARVAPAARVDADSVAQAAEAMRVRHLPELQPSQRRHFAAGLDLVLAAAHYRNGNLASAIPALLRSIARVPYGNRALANVWHNRVARGVAVLANPANGGYTANGPGTPPPPVRDR